LKANSIIGKMTQKQSHYDTNDLIRFAKEVELPVEILANTLGLEADVKKKLSTGTLFYPEWYCLILGMARAIMAKAIIKTAALQVATDAVFTETDFGDTFDIEGIPFVKQAAGDYVAYRAGLYRHGSDYRYHGGDRKIGKEALAMFLPSTSVLKYEADRIVSLRQALHGQTLGSQYKVARSLSLEWDHKRRLTTDGYSTPYPSEEKLTKMAGDDA